MASKRRTRSTPRRGNVLGRVKRLLNGEAEKPGPVVRVAIRALELVTIPRLTERELRLLAVAEEVGLDRQVDFVCHARVYIALAACSWAVHEDVDAIGRSAALAAAAALGACASENLREVMGLNDKLRVAASTSIEPAVTLVARRVAEGELAGELAIHRALVPALERLESRVRTRDPASETG